jgi:hypothetical protein
MLTDTQIRSFLIPVKLWREGLSLRPDLPPLIVPACDALDIERRAKKGINLRNEAHRYNLCCERIQGITADLAAAENILSPSLIFVRSGSTEKQSPTARSYLALIDIMFFLVKRHNLSYTRVASIFFPPEDSKKHQQLYEIMSNGTNVNELFRTAAKRASLPGEHFAVTPEQCRTAFEQRRILLEKAVSEESAVVDLIELI